MSTSIGDRIRNLREFRDVTQEQLAQRAGVSVDTVRKLEQGSRQSARINTLRALARALDVQLERLVGQPTVTQELSDDGGLIALRDAIQDVSALPGVLADDDIEDPPDEGSWADAVRAATRLYWAGELSELSSTLPLLLRDGRAVARETGTEPVWQQLALAYQLAASLAAQAGHPDWAFQAVEKQLAADRKASDPLAEGMGVSTLSWVLLRQGRWEQAQRVAETKADALEPSIRRATAARYAVYGNLLVAAATPAARGGNQSGAQQLLNYAECAATRSGAVRVYGSAFSVTDVRTQQVNIALAGEESRPGEALRLSARVDVGAISRPVHAASHRVDVAQAQYETGDGNGALATLLEVESQQPEWIKFQTLAATTVREMLEDERRRNTRLRGLASRLGVDPAL
ncbi:helix-turn-helix domain-containing protein [Streptomyces tsukubensis]|uniref:Transcriptional regulator n=1 Tax=Streptomyces tsukubensis TaxID=83656 RepID=A0A1V4AF66_9ACTN|nr:helix-turn-helix transcriptional regulator [Streptomyces tsukubensis]OON82211.1 transcriptional regulator [Streptomyces tsukubensis]QFR92698.1 helix-turn-helix domain-containing protein [Streptomyces tsukubensis]